MNFCCKKWRVHYKSCLAMCYPLFKLDQKWTKIFLISFIFGEIYILEGWHLLLWEILDPPWYIFHVMISVRFHTTKLPYNMTIFSMRNTRTVDVQKKLQLHLLSKPNYCADSQGGFKLSVSMLSYLQLIILLFYTVQAHRCWTTWCLEHYFFMSCTEKQEIMPM